MLEAVYLYDCPQTKQDALVWKNLCKAIAVKGKTFLSFRYGLHEHFEVGNSLLEYVLKKFITPLKVTFGKTLFGLGVPLRIDKECYSEFEIDASIVVQEIARS